jgi:hypothetical protein
MTSELYIYTSLFQFLYYFRRSLIRLLVTANVVPSSLILSTLMMKAIRSSETSVHIGTTRMYIPEDGNIMKIFYVESVHKVHAAMTLTFLLDLKERSDNITCRCKRNYR